MAQISVQAVKTLRCRAPAKINLVLRVLDRLPNGYHAIWSIMQAVDLADDLTIRVYPERSGIRVRCNDPRLPVGKSNLVHRAAQMVLAQCRRAVGVEIDLTKRIPVGAGLGGGSSDAAAVMIGLSAMLGLEWSPETMLRLGGELGSDVPFFMCGPCALVQGWGQDVQPLALVGRRWIVLVTPSFSIHTGWAYAQLDARRSTVVPVSARLVELGARREFAWEDLAGLMENDFEPALFVQYRELERIKSALLARGAEAALLSGSGSTMFGVFRTREQAERTASVLAQARAQVMVVGTQSAGGREIDS